jgi:hypothetical protein
MNNGDPHDNSNTSKKKQKANFINQFVNAVYGILLGYGFCDAMQEIKKGSLNEDVGRLYSSVAVIFVIIVVCVNWWDWVKNIGSRVESNAREFAIDMAILVSLEGLFFTFEYPIIFNSIFFLMSILSLVWVINFIEEQGKQKGFKSFRKFVKENDEYWQYIFKRCKGVILYLICLVLTVTYILIMNFIEGGGHMMGNGVLSSYLRGYWIELILVVSAFSINRYLYFRNRPLD